jgi:hypothetical protein
MQRALTSIPIGLGAVAAIFAIADSESAADVATYLWPYWLLGVGTVAILVLIAIRMRLGGPEPTASEHRPQSEIVLGAGLQATLQRNSCRIPTFNDQPQLRLVDAGERDSDVPSPSRDFHEWVATKGGVDLRRSMLRLTVQGTNTRTIVLTGLRARILDRKASPQTGIPLQRPTAGAIEIRYLEIDLDGNEFAARWSMAPGKPAQPFAFSVSEGEVEIFDIVATATQGDVSWVLELSYESEGRAHTLLIPEQDRALRTVGADVPAWYEWAFGNAWVLCHRDTPEIKEISPGSQLEALSL